MEPDVEETDGAAREKMSDIRRLQIRYAEADEGELLSLIEESGLGMDMRLQFNEGMFVQDKEAGYKVFSLCVAVSNEKLAALLEATKEKFEGVWIDDPLPQLTPERAAAARKRLEAQGFRFD